MDGISGRTALVTGGSGGLGREVVRRLAEAGARVAFTYRTGKDRAIEVVEQVAGTGGDVRAIAMDQTDPASVDRAVAQAIEELGSLSILVTAAGVAKGPKGDLDAFTPELFDELMAANLRGPFLVARAAAQHLQANDTAHIVNVGSTIGYGRLGADFPFSISKRGVTDLTRYLAATLAPTVRVNCVAPGFMAGTVMNATPSKGALALWTGEALLNATTDVEDVADEIVRLCRTTTTTGQTLVMDGGIHFN